MEFLELNGAQASMIGRDWVQRAVLSRMPELCPENTSAGVSGMSTRPGDPKEQLGAAGNLWPSEPIILGREGSARELVLRKIQELSIEVRREGEPHPSTADTQEGFPFPVWGPSDWGFPGPVLGS